MKIKIITIGKTQKKFLIDGENEYFSRLAHYVKVERIELPEVKNAKKKSIVQLKKEQGKVIIAHIEKGGIIVLLDENGKQRSSVEFSTWLQNKLNQGPKHITFIIGGPYGFSKLVYEAALEKCSLSKMTFGHQMIRLLFLEQLYRAFTILRNEPYHHQ